MPILNLLISEILLRIFISSYTLTDFKIIFYNNFKELQTPIMLYNSILRLFPRSYKCISQIISHQYYRKICQVCPYNIMCIAILPPSDTSVIYCLSPKMKPRIFQIFAVEKPPTHRCLCLGAPEPSSALMIFFLYYSIPLLVMVFIAKKKKKN